MTKIEWVARPGTIPTSWSPVTGCTPISEGCKFCWAKRMARRLAGRCGYPEAPHHFDVILRPDRLKQPLRWQKPRTVFVCSMSDLFHVNVSDEFIGKVFQVMYECPQHTFQVLTKRPERMRDFILTGKYLRDGIRPIEWIWLGITAENQATADERILFLLQTPAAVRFVSCEPLLGPIRFPELWLKGGTVHGLVEEYKVDHLNWIIVGGESGPGARPMHPQWARDIRDQCIASNTAYFFKQWGAWFPRSQWEDNPDLILPDDCDCIDGHNLKIIDDDILHRVGKKRASHLLDGETWHQWPEG